MSRAHPRIAVTIGDPSGIGPEITVKAIATRVLGGPITPPCINVIVGDHRVVQDAISRFAPDLAATVVDSPDDAVDTAGVYIYDVPAEFRDRTDPTASQGTHEVGAAAHDSLHVAVQQALRGQVDAIVTAPLNKEALSLAGHVGVGHTELLADFCGIARADVAMMLSSTRLKVAHVSTHVPLREAVNALSSGRIETVARLAGTAVARSLGRQPIIAVAGINPHAGESGLFGREEIEIIEPAVQSLEAEGWNVVGPVAPDTVFARALNGAFDVVIAMYHDQGHIPSKLTGFHDTVNVTLGLPIIRVSVDHGTAYDIAWTGKADAGNMGVAITEAIRMVGVIDT